MHCREEFDQTMPETFLNNDRDANAGNAQYRESPDPPRSMYVATAVVRHV